MACHKVCQLIPSIRRGNPDRKRSCFAVRGGSALGPWSDGLPEACWGLDAYFD